MKSTFPVFLSSFLLATFIAFDASAAAIDWSGIAPTKIKVFYPGVASWEFLHSADHGRGASVVRSRKKACRACHVSDDGEIDIKANKIITGELTKSESHDPFEPEPIAGAPGFKDVTFQTAYDAENIYFRFQWKGSGASVADPSLEKTDSADRIVIQIARKIGSFKAYGCFITCHDDQVGMPADDGSKVTLYGYYTRDREGNLRDQSVLDGFMSKQQFIDLLEVKFVGSEVKTEDMYILEKRKKDDTNDVVATGNFENGTYTVEISRKLSTGDKDDITLEDGADFDLGFAIHDNKNHGRKHYVSYPLSVGLSAPADVEARKF